MPICPGCEQTVSYDRLDVHERYCDGIWTADQVRRRATRDLERRLVDVERRLNGQLRTLETDVERRLQRLEAARSSNRTTRRK